MDQGLRANAGQKPGWEAEGPADIIHDNLRASAEPQWPAAADKMYILLSASLWGSATHQTRIDPYPTLRRLQREDPVHWCDAIGAWLFTRYDDIVPTFRNVCTYSNEGRLSKVVEYLPAESRAHYKVLEEHFRAKSLIFSDPPDHTRLRALVTKVFNATRVEEMRPRITELIDKRCPRQRPRGCHQRHCCPASVYDCGRHHRGSCFRPGQREAMGR